MLISKLGNLKTFLWFYYKVMDLPVSLSSDKLFNDLGIVLAFIFCFYVKVMIFLIIYIERETMFPHIVL